MKKEIEFSIANIDPSDIHYVCTTEHHMNPNHEAGMIERSEYGKSKGKYIFVPSGSADLTVENLKTIIKFMEKITKETK